MMNPVTRRSRRGIAPVYLIAGGVAAVGILGFLLYKHYKKKNEQPPYVQNYYNQQSYSQAQPYAQGYDQHVQGMPNPIQKGGKGGGYGYGYAYAPSAPESSGRGGDHDTRRSSTDDPELSRLYRATQDAHARLTAAMSTGDQDRATEARRELAQAQAALAAKKQSLY
jgi:hypothetical protein